MLRMRGLLFCGVSLLALAASGCRTTDEISEPATTESPGWSSEFRASDKETAPLGLSSRAREIERSVGVGR